HALGSAMTVKGTAARGADGRPSVQAVASAEKIDLDAILAALKQPVPAAAQPASPPPAGTPAKPAPAGHMIPDTPLPLGTLRLADADVKLNAAQLVWGGVAYRAINGHLELRGGKLRLDPLSADLPEGHVDAVLSVDSAQATPAVALRLQSPGLALAALLAALKEPAYATGTVQVHADLRGNGATPHAIASTLEGTASLAMGGGSIDNRLLGSSLGSVLRAVNLLDLVGRGGASEIKCFAANIDAKGGIAALRSFVFASSLLTMDGSGSVNLGAETLDLRVRPQARVAGTGIVVPLRITGPWRSPATTPDAASAVTDNAGTVAGAVLGNATPFGALAGALGSRQASGAPGGCNSAPATPSLPAQQPKPPNVGGVLKQLFR
ncbi:MAG TPA: AsmA-like C-terminal region-containing protein, partial [Acetobacteraceae bacterium]|nr:AsmA-like C-terminal region-containing protein [Acetobacteraceae bacterium]